MNSEDVGVKSRVERTAKPIGQASTVVVDAWFPNLHLIFPRERPGLPGGPL